MFTENNIRFMQKALSLAKKSYSNDDVPVGAVIVLNNEIISSAYNKIEKKNNSINHAEIIAINLAIKKIGYKHLLNCDMYITLEPCSMCAGAIVLSRIKRVYIGTYDTKTGAAGSLYNILDDKRLNHRCEIHYGLLESECSQILKDFFKELRIKKKIGK